MTTALDLQPLGDGVRRLRRARGLTLRELADRAGLSERFLSDLERGRGNISIGRLVSVSLALDVPLRDLVAPLDDAQVARRKTSPAIVLVGLRGAGKSTIGALAASALGVRFVEVDQEIEAAAGLPLGQIFELHGEAYYRRLEREILARHVRGREPAVLAVGGGVVTDPESWTLLKQHAKTVWLKAAPEEHYGRVMAQGDLRPMDNRPAAMAELRALLAAREGLYAESDLTVDSSGKSVGETLSGLLSALV